MVMLRSLPYLCLFYVKNLQGFQDIEGLAPTIFLNISIYEKPFYSNQYLFEL